MKCNSYNQFFEVIAGRTRLRIIEILMGSDLCVNDICRKLGEEQSKISHNLKTLLNCHIVERKIVGKTRVYSLNKITIRPIMEIVEKHVASNCDRRCWVKR